MFEEVVVVFEKSAAFGDGEGYCGIPGYGNMPLQMSGRLRYELHRLLGVEVVHDKGKASLTFKPTDYGEEFVKADVLGRHLRIRDL